MFSLVVSVVAAFCVLLALALPALAGLISPQSAAVVLTVPEPSSPVVAVKTVKRVHWVIDPIDNDPANLKYNNLRQGTAVPLEAEFNATIHICRRKRCYNCYARNGRVPSKIPMEKLEKEDFEEKREAERTVLPLTKTLQEFILYEMG